MSEDELTPAEKAVISKGSDGLKKAGLEAALTKTRPKYTEIIKEAIKNLGENARRSEIIDYALKKNPECNEGTLSAHVNFMTVNVNSRCNYGANEKPRGLNPEYDVLYKIKTGVYTLYDSNKHGLYTIEMGQDGKTYAAKDGKIIGENSESRLLKFVRDEMVMNEKYQPVVIKMLLENKDNAFRVSYENIKDKFDELSFDSERFPKTGKRNIGSFGSTMDSVKDSKFGKEFASFPDGATNGNVTLHLNKFDSKDIPEILKICGQKIAQWHIDNIADDELQVWRVLPGKREEGFIWKNEFRETNTIGVDYGIKEDLRPAQQTIDDVKNRLDEFEEKRSKQKFSKKGSVTAITHKIKPKDIIVLTEGQKEVIDFGIVTSEYFFDSNPANEKHYSHRRKVVWLNQGPLSSDVGDVGDITGSQHAVHEIDGKDGERKRKAIEILTGRKEEKYFLLRYTGKNDGPWKDVLGEKYHIGRNANGSLGTNVGRIRDAGVGTKAVWWYTKGPIAILGYGKIKEIETINENKDWYLKFDDFKFFEGDEMVNGHMMKRANDSTVKLIQSLEKKNQGGKKTDFNWLSSINPISKKVYEEITSDRSHMSSSGLSNTVNVEPFIHALKWKPNLVLYGPPGTGKTFHANEIAKSIVGDDSELIAKVTFHPSYSYEDFVEGYRPVVEEDSTKQYELKKGIFWETCEKAREVDPDLPPEDRRKVILIIDEINRGNIPKIFGELITLIEEDKREEKYALKLAYSQDPFFVPKNLLIIGTMNTADKSLMQMDDALKRRFVFEELMPDTKALRENFKKNNVSDGENYAKILEKINEKIIGKGANDEKQKKIQFRDRQIGQSYFWNVKSDGDLQDVIKYDIIPLLQDYFYGDYDEIRKVLGKKIIGDDNRPTSLVTERNKASDLKDELLEIK